MRLSDREIQEYLEDKKLLVVGPRDDYPFDRFKQVQPCSIDLRLDSQFHLFKIGIKQFDVRDLENIWDFADRFCVNDDEPIVLEPNSILFGQIYEQLRIPDDCSGKIVGRSRFARLGLAVHATGDFINPEFEGAMPLQLINHNRFPIVIYPYMNICQLILVKLTSTPIVPYSKKSSNPYHKERVAGASVLHTDPVVSKNREIEVLQCEIERGLVEKHLKEREHSKLIEGLSSNMNEESSRNTGGTIIIKNSNVGVLNPGEIIGNVKSRVQSYKTEDSSEVDALRALQEIATYLQNKPVELSEQQYIEAVSLTDDLSKQAVAPTEERSSASTSSIILDRLGQILEIASKGSSLWQQYAPVLQVFFGAS